MHYAKFDAQGERITSIVQGINFYDDNGLQKYIDDGFIKISDADQALYATNNYIRDTKTGRPILRPVNVPTVQEVANQKWTEIKTARDAAEQSGCPYMDKTLDSDTTSVQRIAIAVQAAQQSITAGAVDFTLDWTMQDNSTIKMTANEVIGMSAALAAHSNSLHERARQCREQIEQIAVDYEKGEMDEEAARTALIAIEF